MRPARRGAPLRAKRAGRRGQGPARPPWPASGARPPGGLLRVRSVPGAVCWARGVVPWVVSGRGAEGLRGQAERLRDFGSAEEDLAVGDVGLSLAGRPLFEGRGVVLGGDRAELLAGLDTLAGGGAAANVARGVFGVGGAGGVVFVFPGQGSQWEGMAVELLDCSPVFAAALRECGEALGEFVDWSVEDVLRGAAGAPSLERIEVVQPVLFAVMVSLARLWGACGVRPDAVVGHSQGEIAAAYVAGGLSLRDAARVMALRSRMLAGLAGRGGVASVALGVEQVRERLRRWDGRAVVAGANGPRSVVVAGDREALRELLEECAAEDVRAREVPGTVASHSPLGRGVSRGGAGGSLAGGTALGGGAVLLDGHRRSARHSRVGRGVLVPEPAGAGGVRAGDAGAAGRGAPDVHRDQPPSGAGRRAAGNRRGGIRGGW